MSKIVVLMGAPGAGKGTQARLVRERLGLPQISTGDIFRAMKEAETPLAEEVRAILASGRLVPDEVTARVVRERTAQADCREGYVLDGFPRTAAQAETLETLAREQGHEIVAVVVDVPVEILEKRMTGRRNCPVCGEIYNVYFKPPRVEGFCDLHPEARLNQRADDNEETIRTRLATYERETQPLFDYYERTGRLRRVEGTRDPEAIYRDVEKIVTSD
ncbi:MAG TPA: adenylate kinase [Pyrinomonadaceae bacterium]|nr:adenylate kinase [Pyrinomonadaceae bacterium]